MWRLEVGVDGAHSGRRTVPVARWASRHGIIPRCVMWSRRGVVRAGDPVYRSGSFHPSRPTRTAMGIILVSIPFFFLLIGGELAYAAWSGRRLFRLNDSVADLSCGILSQVSGVFSKLFAIGIYLWVLNHLAVQRWIAPVPAWVRGAPFARAEAFPWFHVNAAALASWAAVFVLVDFCYYWSHRLSHEINVLWAGHVVHHSSEEYNLAVALRQSSLHGLFTWVF